MSLSQGMLWIPIPRGLDRGIAPRITLVIIPQLTSTAGSTTLAAFPDLAGGRWADLVAGGGGAVGMSFTVTFDDPASGQRMSGPAKRVSADPDRDMLRTMFPDSTRVDSYVADDYSRSLIRSANVAGLAAALDRLQEEVFRGSPTVRPEVSSLVGPEGGLLSGFALDDSTLRQLEESVDRQLRDDGYTASTNTETMTGLQTAIVQLRQFLSPVETDPAIVTAPVQWPGWEFHEKFSVLDSHPNLLRSLGFVIDVEVDPAELRSTGPTPTTTIPPNGEVRVNPGYSPAGGVTTANLPTGVRYLYSPGASEFAPRYRRSPASPGFVDIRGDGVDWPIVTSEVSSETLATTALATGLQRAEDGGLATTASRLREGLPARSSAGIILGQPRSAERLHDAFARQWSIARTISFGTSTMQVLDAEELVIGYRMDIRPSGVGPWRSLNLRNGFWRPDPDTFGTGVVDLGVDEGWTEPAGASPETNAANEYRYSGVVSAWVGWSQSIERPGGAVGEESRTAFINPLSPPPPQFGATIDYRAPTSGAQLPTLRFGTLYEVRLREVFLGGAARELTSPAPPSAIRSVTYRRHEPVMSPAVYLGEVPDPAATYSWAQTPDTAVIRSAGNGAPADPTEIVTRFLTPPRVTPWLVEQHGRLDSGGRPDPAKYAEIAARDAANYSAATPGVTVVGDIVAFTGRGAAQGLTPFFPDPIGSGVLLRGIPGSGAREASAGFGGTWPDLIPVRVDVSGVGSPGATVTGQLVNLRVAPGRTEYLRASCSIPVADLALLDLWARVGSSAATADAAKGAFWQLSPDARITVVHAVKQPVSAPRFAALDAWTARRRAGRTQATLRGSATLDQPSIASVALSGELTSGIDGGPGTPAPMINRNPTGDLGTVDVDNPAPGGMEVSYPLTATIQLPDARRRDITLGVIATSRYAEYFRQERSATVSGGRADTIVVVPDGSGAAQSLVPGSSRINWTTAGTLVVGVAGLDFTEDAVGGTVTIVPGGAIPTGPVVVSGITTPITLGSSEAVTPAERTVEVTIPAGIRPTEPSVASIVPALRWNSIGSLKAGGRVTSERRGGSLRIYLDRPWWSSGVGEDLAILLKPARGSSAIADFVSRWGADPAMAGGGSLPTAWPQARHFTNAAGFEGGVVLAEDRSLRVDLVRFDVGREGADGSLIGWDAARDEWYVDVDINADSAYRPFLRLALARYQEGAPPALRLSPVALLDVVQLEPDRIAALSLARQPGGNRARITLTGPSYQRNEAGSGPGQAIVAYESLDPGVEPTSDSAFWREISRRPLSGTYARRTGEATWTGTIDVPADISGGRHRLVLEQYEEWRTDGSPTSSGSTTGLRLVHQDVIPLG